MSWPVALGSLYLWFSFWFLRVRGGRREGWSLSKRHIFGALSGLLVAVCFAEVFIELEYVKSITIDNQNLAALQMQIAQPGL